MVSGNRRERSHMKTCIRHQVNRELKMILSGNPQLTNLLPMSGHNMGNFSSFSKRRNSQKETSYVYDLSYVSLVFRIMDCSENALNPKKISIPKCNRICDSNSSMSVSLAGRQFFERRELKLTIDGINSADGINSI